MTGNFLCKEIPEEAAAESVCYGTCGLWSAARGVHSSKASKDAARRCWTLGMGSSRMYEQQLILCLLLCSPVCTLLPILPQLCLGRAFAKPGSVVGANPLDPHHGAAFGVNCSLC